MVMGQRTLHSRASLLLYLFMVDCVVMSLLLIRNPEGMYCPCPFNLKVVDEKSLILVFSLHVAMHLESLFFTIFSKSYLLISLDCQQIL